MRYALFTILLTTLSIISSVCMGRERMSYTSPTEGVITNEFVSEQEMKADLLQMLAAFSQYMADDWQECQATNSVGEACGFFKGENSGGSDERGVRPNADLSMICAFLVKYGKPQGIALPANISWQEVEQMAMKSLVFAYSTHKANRLKVCAGGRYWGSTSAKDAVWESSLWAMSVAYSAFFQWDRLNDQQREYVRQLLRAECNYELERNIPTGYRGDTKAEENGWEADVLAAALGLMPNDSLAPRWFERLREFAINSYSHPSDADNHTIIDPHYDQRTVADLYRGQNLYEDYTLQNHNLFHTSYQNVVMQELGEAALAMRLFQRETGSHEERWMTQALMHHNREVMDSVMCWLALADGELAMPNGNDWSLFLYDQITSYSTMACMMRDPNALMLENMAYKYIKARQKTTKDGSWLLRADVGARRMGVEAHRVMMTYLMHELWPTYDLAPTSWNDFEQRHREARLIRCQDIVRASSESRFTTFSWSKGLRSYTGYIAANSADRNKIIVPYRAHNTGNIVGWHEVKDKPTDARPAMDARYQMAGNAYVMNGELVTNGGSLDNRFAIYSTPGNAVIYIDHVTAIEPCVITCEKGGLLAISTDEMTNTSRTLYYSNCDRQHTDSITADGSEMVRLATQWVNIDNEVGIVGIDNGRQMAFGNRENNNSVMTAKLYPMFSDSTRTLAKGETANCRRLIYCSMTDAEKTEQVWRHSKSLADILPDGWNGVMVSDTDNEYYLMIANFRGTGKASLEGLQTCGYAPVMNVPTTVTDSRAFAGIELEENTSLAQPLTMGVKGSHVTAQMEDDASMTISATKKTRITVAYLPALKAEGKASTKICIRKGEKMSVRWNKEKKLIEICSKLL
ncbi:MAG: hypothetical protein KBT20_08570 [Bacteroidales bacterium]|nr:hypothetical protein [Candidatus Liminaster caballi]